MIIRTVEDAYSELANYLVAYIGQRSWDIAHAHFSIFSSMARGSQSLGYQGLKDESGGFEENPDAIWSGLDAAIFLRDDLLKTTGQRIWGLTFTLFPDGKFHIEYDYDKPEGYEETDETIEVNLNSDIPGQSPSQ